ncbi:MAG TPA: hypothetical protein VEZ70_03275 [Allosphingosinicella sp.]|nr:hypothetical protein [Allosphingosinicella sp.]
MADIEAIQRSLLDSAFAFLQRAISEFDQDHRFSVVHFAIATELFLKARLIEEHWSLLFKDVDRATAEAFERGEFVSVSVAQTLTRLKAIAGVSVTKDAEGVIHTIGGHRNRVVHFALHHDTEEAKAAAQREVALEQLKGWFHIKHLLRQWFGSQDHFVGKLWQVNQSMGRHRAFLAVVFEGLADELALEKAGGTEFRQCVRCAFVAAKRSRLTQYYSEVICRVCGQHDSIIEVPCDNCGAAVQATGYEASYPTCQACEHQLEESELSEILDTGEDEYPHTVSKNCAECMGYHKVIQHEEIYVCLQCFGHADEMPTCDWCNEGQINGGDLEFSFHRGCEFCDGRGWDRD